MNSISKTPQLFPSLKAIFREQIKKREERELIKEFHRFQNARRTSIPTFCKLKQLDLGSFRRLLRKHGINAPIMDRTYKDKVNILSEYYGVKPFYRKYILENHDLKACEIHTWRKNFVIHQNKDESVKLILINKEWPTYLKHLEQKGKKK